jgi:predicted metal-dependent HD superfamily phosphohydrolase
MSLTSSLRERWITLAGPDAAVLGDELIFRWAEAHRKYHTLSHLTVVLDGVDELAAHADDVDAVRYAAWFHDAVYHSGAQDDGERDDRSNEELSALLAEAELPKIGVPADRVAEVARLVRLTTSHAASENDRNGSVLCDADLAILGSEPEAYAAYTKAIRAEYASIPDEFFRPGRAAILRDLLALPFLFRTPLARERYESPARANLRAEIDSLTA